MNAQTQIQPGIGDARIVLARARGDKIHALVGLHPTPPIKWVAPCTGREEPVPGSGAVR